MEIRQNTENIRSKMQAQNDERIVELFCRYYQKLASGDRGNIFESDILPVEYGSIPKFDDIKKSSKTKAKTAIIKLNGGLGTSMGMDFPKSFVEVREQKRFIDLAVMQVESDPVNQEVALLFMNSENTKEMTDKFIAENQILREQKIRPAFLQHSFPKVLKDTLEIAQNPENRALEFNPAGHGDVFMSLFLSGILDELINEGFEFAFISNIDNAAATFEASIVNFMEDENIDFLMEVCRRGEMDKKGGHIAKTKDGHFLLRERAQVVQSEIAEFEDIAKYSYFNTNSIWLNLRKLKEIITKNGYVLELPFIANEKTLDPNDKSTPKVYQIEQAMGAAIRVFDNARVLEVGKERFFPVKTTNDLFLLRSDRFFLENAKIKSFDDNKTECIVLLNTKFYGNLHDFEKRMENFEPRLKKCKKLKVESDVFFAENYKNIEFEEETELW